MLYAEDARLIRRKRAFETLCSRDDFTEFRDNLDKTIREAACRGRTSYRLEYSQFKDEEIRTDSLLILGIIFYLQDYGYEASYSPYGINISWA